MPNETPKQLDRLILRREVRLAHAGDRVKIYMPTMIFTNFDGPSLNFARLNEQSGFLLARPSRALKLPEGALILESTA